MLRSSKIKQQAASAVAAAANAAAGASTSSASSYAASHSPALPIPSLASTPPRRAVIKAGALKAARRARVAREGFDVEGPKLSFLEQEKLLRSEIVELERALETTTQVESSKKATEHLPPLDELALEQIYQALMLPEPLTPAEERLLLLDQRRSETRSVLALEDPNAETSLSERTESLPLSQAQHNALMQAQVKSGNTLRAIQTLTAMEMSSTPAQISTYTLMIDHLINHPSNSRALQSCAWSIFYHMRLAAHPVPDTPLYALMLHACAKGVPQPSDVLPISSRALPVVRAARQMRDPSKSDADRALDLFREMGAYNITPNAEIYNNVILACCRSGKRHHYYEAFRLLREMLNKGDAVGRVDDSLAGILWEDHPDPAGPASLSKTQEARQASTLRFTPDRYTFHAFLQGCAKQGDLGRARWILAEMIRSASYHQRALGKLSEADFQNHRHDVTVRRQLKELEDCRPSAETLTHVFYTYASYKPPLRRSQLKVVSEQSMPATRTSSTVSEDFDTHPQVSGPTEGATDGVTVVRGEDGGDAAQQPALRTESTDINKLEDDAATTFTLQLPQTSADVLREVRALMARILADRAAAVDAEGTDTRDLTGSALSTVRPTVHLANAYMSAVLAHSSSVSRLSIFEDSLALLPDAGQALIGEHSDADPGLHYGSRAPEHGLYARLGLQPNSKSYLVGLKLCAGISTKKVDRANEADQGPGTGVKEEDVMTSAHRFWNEWQRLDMLESVRTGFRPEEAISIAKGREQAWAARIRVLAKFNHVEEAIAVLKEFIALYPPERPGKHPDPYNTTPSAVEPVQASAATDEPTPPSSPAARSLAVSRSKKDATKAADALSLPVSLLNGLGPLSVPPEAYRVLLSTQGGHLMAPLASSWSHASDTVRPGLTFADLDLLHHRLVNTDGPIKKKGLAVVTWAGRAYEAAKKERW
ncbi:hypothetical protein OC846_000951 [Tilletia horrida]|uniref:Pentacotripeptide-repeat region of PRORP domain-containing protein n=1 Tax=Tilletia horrida TaxID=155126 RepID=A0AAN6GWY4_9BASI|nr:hypothetical protein OC846_000951 [Tilletia horrida]